MQGCLEDELECSTDSFCIDEGLSCDGMPNCPSASDELDCQSSGIAMSSVLIFFCFIESFFPSTHEEFSENIY